MKKKIMKCTKRALCMALSTAMIASSITVGDWGYQVYGATGTTLPTIGARSGTNSYGDVFLGGNYMEIGISKGGSFGTQARPEASYNFHYTSDLYQGVGLLADSDGWEVGNPPVTGDFFLPGTPEERWGIGYYIDGVKYEYIVADRETIVNKNSWKKAPYTTNVSNDTELQAVVQAETGEGVKIKMTYSFGVDDISYLTHVDIENTGTKEITNVRFLRSFDPDQDADFFTEHKTYNKVVCQPDADLPAGEDNYAMVVARGKMTLSGFFFLAFDNRAKASILKSLYASNGVYDKEHWEDAPTASATYATDESVELTKEMVDAENYNGFALADKGISLSFDLGTIDRNGKDSLEYFSSLNPNVKEELHKVLRVQSNITSSSITISNPDTTMYYALFDEEGNVVRSWTDEMNEKGYIVFDELDDNTKYVMKGIPKEDYDKNKAPEAQNKDAISEAEVMTAIYPLKKEEGEPAAAIEPVSKVVKGTNLNTDYVYNLIDERGMKVYASYLEPDENGNLDFPNLTGGKVYYLVAKTEENPLSDRLRLQTLYSVSFDTQGIGENPEDIEGFSLEGTDLLPKVENPVDPKNEYIFVGWYKKSTCEKEDEWDNWTDTVDKNITLYAKWKAHTHSFRTRTPVVEWLEDYTKAKIKVECDKKEECGLLLVKEGKVTSETTATCTEDGIRTVSAAFDYLGDGIDDYKCKKSVVQKALGHDMTHVEATEANCQNPGNTEYYYCERCDKYFADEAAEEEITLEETVIPSAKLGQHKMTKIERVESTCSVKGNMEYWECSICHGKFSTESGKKMSGNDVVSSIISSSETILPYATCGGHEEMEHFDRIDPVCDAQGRMEYWQCKACHKLFSTIDGTKIEEEVTVSSEIHLDDTVLDMTEHDLTKTEAKGADCKENGNVAYYTCSICNKIFIDGTGKEETTLEDVKIARLEHSMNHIDAVDATCTRPGNVEYWLCDYCGEYYSTASGLKEDETSSVIENIICMPLGHAYDTNFTIDTPATCTVPGSKSCHCTRSGCTSKKYVTVISPLGHMEGASVEEDRVEATCEAEGSYNEVIYCTVCEDKIVSHPRTIEKLPHNWDAGSVTVTPTCTAVGEMTYNCNDCTATKTEEIPMQPHSYTLLSSTPATCTTAGVENYECSVCHDSYVTILDATGHDFTEQTIQDDTTKISDVSCTTPEAYFYSCSKCHQISTTKSYEKTPQLFHRYALDYYDWNVDCTECTAYFVCETCKDEKNITKKADEITVTPTTATCEEDGLEIYNAIFVRDFQDVSETDKLEEFTASESVPVAALGHVYQTPEYDWSEDGKSCDVEFVCERDVNHKIIFHATMDPLTTSAQSLVASKELIAATCEAKGTTEYTVTVLLDRDGDGERESYTDTKEVMDLNALGHAYEFKEFQWSEDYSEAKAIYECQNDAKHSLSYEIEVKETVKEANCTIAGKATYRVSYKNEDEEITHTDKKEIEIPALGHTWQNSFTVDIPATCTEEGSKSIHCEACDAIKYGVVVPAKGHDWDEGVEIDKPTCNKGGVILYTCQAEDCEVTKEETVPEKGHSWENEYTVDTPATCYSEGKMSVHCAACSSKRLVQAIPMTEHKLDSGVVTKATCSTDGKAVYTCTTKGCTYTKTEVIPAVGHKVGAPTKKGEVKPTCTKAGYYYETVSCTECGEELAKSKRTTSALGHSFTKYVNDNNATLLSDGTKTAACDHGCGEKDVVIIEGSKGKNTTVSDADKKKIGIILNEGLKVTQSGSSLTIKWGAAEAADGYLVYVGYCGKSYDKAITVKGSANNSKIVKKIGGETLDLKANYKVYVKAYKTVSGKKIIIGNTIVGHVVGVKNATYTNPKNITLAKTAYTLNVGKTAKIDATVVLTDAKKKPLGNTHAKEKRYATTDSKVATVSSTGVITAKGKGTCYVYVYARNGFAKKAKVTVK